MIKLKSQVPTFQKPGATATYGGLDDDENFYENMEVGCTEEYARPFIVIYKDRDSVIGTYKYAVRILIPIEEDESDLRAFVDLRWGRFRTPLLFIESNK